MQVLSLPAHLATLAVHGEVKVAVVDALPTHVCRACRSTGSFFNDLVGAFVPCTNPHCDGGYQPLDLTGQQIGLRAQAGRAAEVTMAARMACAKYRVSYGCIVGSAVVEAVVPIVDYRSHGPRSHPPNIPCLDANGGWLTYWWHHDGGFRDLTDQLAYQSFTPGSHALILTDPKPCEQRCPACWGSGWKYPEPFDLTRCDTCNPTVPCEGDCACPTSCPPIRFDTSDVWSTWPQ